MRINNGYPTARFFLGWLICFLFVLWVINFLTLRSCPKDELFFFLLIIYEYIIGAYYIISSLETQRSLFVFSYHFVLVFFSCRDNCYLKEEFSYNFGSKALWFRKEIVERNYGRPAVYFPRFSLPSSPAAVEEADSWALAAVSLTVCTNSPRFPST